MCYTILEFNYKLLYHLLSNNKSVSIWNYEARKYCPFCNKLKDSVQLLYNGKSYVIYLKV